MKIIEPQKLKTFARAATPWCLAIGLFLLLKVTGVGNTIAMAAQGALLKAGVMDVNPKTPVSREETFDYDFAVKDLEGKKVPMSAMKGKVIFLNLWATWCGPCRVEMPSIQNLYNAVDKDKVVFVMLSLDQESDKPKIAQFISSREFNFPVYQPASPLPKLLRVNTIPTTFIIGPDGKVKSKKTGMANYDTDEMKEFLKELSGGV